MQGLIKDEKNKKNEVSRILMDANYELIKQNIKEKELLKVLFDGDFSVKINFKPEQVLNFSDVKTTIIRNIPNVERGISLTEQYVLKLEKHYSFLYSVSEYNSANLSNMFINNIDKNLGRIYDQINKQMAMNFNNAEESSEVIGSINETNLVPEELRISHFQSKIRTKIISFSNELNSIANITNVSNKSVIEFIQAGEKILALYQVLRSEESGAALNIVNNAPLFSENYKVNTNMILNYICSKKPIDALSLLQINDELIVQRIIQNFHSYSFTNPENIKMIHEIKKNIISDLHKIIADEERTNEEITCYSRKNFKYVVYNSFLRERNRIHIEIRNLIGNILNQREKIYTGEKEFEDSRKHLEGEMGRIRRQLDLLRNNEYYRKFLNNEIKPQDIRSMILSDENLKKLTGIEKLIRDLIESTKDQKNLAELILFTHKEEEILFKTKLFEVFREVGTHLFLEYSRNNLNRLVEDLFNRLIESVNRFHIIDENSLEEKIFEEMQKGKGINNPYLARTLQAISGPQYFKNDEPKKGLHNYETGYVDPHEREIAMMETIYSNQYGPEEVFDRTLEARRMPREIMPYDREELLRTHYPGDNKMRKKELKPPYNLLYPKYDDHDPYYREYRKNKASIPYDPSREHERIAPYYQKTYLADLKRIAEINSGTETRGRYDGYKIKENRVPLVEKHHKHKY